MSEGWNDEGADCCWQGGGLGSSRRRVAGMGSGLEARSNDARNFGDVARLVVGRVRQFVDLGPVTTADEDLCVSEGHLSGPRREQRATLGAKTLAGNLVDRRVFLYADEIAPTPSGSDASRSRAHGEVEDGLACTAVGLNQILHQIDGLLSPMQAAVLCVARERQDGARIALGAIVVVVASHVPVDFGLQVLAAKGPLAFVPSRLLRVVVRLPVAEEADDLMLSQRLTLGVQEAGALGLVPDPIVLELAEVGGAQQRREWLGPKQDNGSAALGDMTDRAPHVVEGNDRIPLALRGAVRDVGYYRGHLTQRRQHIPAIAQVQRSAPDLLDPAHAFTPRRSL